MKNLDIAVVDDEENGVEMVFDKYPLLLVILPAILLARVVESVKQHDRYVLGTAE